MSVVSLTDYAPRERYDGNAWTSVNIEGTIDLEEWSIIESIDLDPPDEDPANPLVRNFTITLDEPDVSFVRVVWLDDASNQDVTDPVSLIEPNILATVRDVELRLGQDLNERQSQQVEVLLMAATNVILTALDQDQSWDIPLEHIPTLSMLCVEVVCRARTNPAALGAQSESLGAYSRSTTFAREIPGSGLLLTRAEELMIRRLVYGSNAAVGTSYDLSMNGSALFPMAWIR